MEGEVVPIDDDENEMEEAVEWMSDREKAQRVRQATWKPAGADATPRSPPSRNNRSSIHETDFQEEGELNLEAEEPDVVEGPRRKRLTYTDEEEELIEILGGKEVDKPSRGRQDGYLGDSTLKEVALDYQVPICYLADVLCGWGVPPPIDPTVILGDMVTGEQAFAILEAIHTLDVGSLNDRYAECDLMTLCSEYGIDFKDGFELAMKEGWNLPFGVRTFLRVEQEDFLIEKLAQDVY
jgi:hypothetical protein